jgi:hypothetical protein
MNKQGTAVMNVFARGEDRVVELCDDAPAALMQPFVSLTAHGVAPFPSFFIK